MSGILNDVLLRSARCVEHFLAIQSHEKFSCGDRTIRFLIITFSYERIAACQAVYVDTFQLWS